MNFKEMAQEIVAARQSSTPTNMDWPTPAPSREDAMAIQAEVFQQLGPPLVGWKVGATTEAAQKAFGIESPFYGPIPQSAVMSSPAKITKNQCVGACEPEYAFKMARDFPAAGEEVNPKNLAGAVDSLHIAIEVIGRAIGNPDYANGVGVTMDFGGNVVFVVGPKVEDWQNQDLTTASVESKVDGQVVETGNGEPIMGHPLNSLLWMAEQLAAKGKHLKAGEWVSTGTCTPAVPAQAGTNYTASFSTFGDVSIDFS